MYIVTDCINLDNITEIFELFISGQLADKTIYKHESVDYSWFILL